jgi:hypothetical protein
MRSALSGVVILGITAICALALAKSPVMLDADIQMSSTYSGTLTGTVLVFKDANDKVIGTCAPDASVTSTNGHIVFDCALSGVASTASEVKLVSDQHTENFPSSLVGPTDIELTNGSVVVGSLYAFDIDGTEPEF